MHEKQIVIRDCGLQGQEDQSLAEQVNMLKQDKRIIMLEVLRLQQNQQVGSKSLIENCMPAHIGSFITSTF